MFKVRYKYLIISIIILSLSCSNKNEVNSFRKDLKDTLINVDREFSNLSVSKNVPKAFTSYAADEVILMRENEFPIVGLDSLKKHYERKKLSKSVLKWEPLKADVSGDIGYTFGSWELKVKTDDGKDTTVYGLYSTVWKKQADGSWKFVLDGGSQTPSKFVLIK